MRVFGEAKVGKDLKKDLMTMHMHAYMQVFVRLYVSGANVWRANTISGVRPLEPSTLLSQGLADEARLVNEPVSTSLYRVPPCSSFSCGFLDPSWGHHAVCQTLC